MAKQKEGLHVDEQSEPGADTYRAALVRAAVLVGGAVPLSRRLQIPMPDLTRWLAGDGRPSMGTFLRVIDVLLEEQGRGRELP